MTPEAALTKLSYLISRKDLTLEKKRQLMEENMRGEMSIFDEHEDVNDTGLLKSLTKLLHVTSNHVPAITANN